MIKQGRSLPALHIRLTKIDGFMSAKFMTRSRELALTDDDGRLSTHRKIFCIAR